MVTYCLAARLPHDVDNHGTVVDYEVVVVWEGEGG